MLQFGRSELLDHCAGIIFKGPCHSLPPLFCHTKLLDYAVSSAIQAGPFCKDKLQRKDQQEVKDHRYGGGPSTISLAAYALLAVIIMFSIINLVNTSMTNIISQIVSCLRKSDSIADLIAFLQVL